jgi:hypothetical protein
MLLGKVVSSLQETETGSMFITLYWYPYCFCDSVSAIFPTLHRGLLKMLLISQKKNIILTIFMSISPNSSEVTPLFKIFIRHFSLAYHS